MAMAMAMDVARSAEAFRAWVSGSSIGQLSPRSLFGAALSFYESQRFDGLIEDRGDMLLFQYGAYDWGSGLHFEIDLTRQFIERTRGDDDDVFSQLRATVLYEPIADLVALGEDESWCYAPSQFDAFANWVSEHPVLAAVERREPKAMKIRWSLV